MRQLQRHANGLGYLLPHEFVHAWIGKYRRPAGMVTGDFHTDKNTEGLWVYEGLTQYLGNVPIIGFFSGCEIAPIQHIESLLQYTGVLVLVGERDIPLQ